MARKTSSNLTDAELRLMQVVWNRGSATVSDVVEALAGDVELAYSTVLTTMRILEDKGYLKHTKEGRAFVYHPLVGREEAKRSAVRQLLARFFGDSSEQLVLNLLDEELTAAELKRIRKMIAESGK
jgi:predicted transcriptional regulator